MKVKRQKRASITLEPDGFSVHTIELSRTVSKKNWRQIKYDLYDYQKKYDVHIIYPDRSCPDHHVCTLYANEGIRIRLERVSVNKDAERYYVRMIVNPRKLIYPQSGYIGILPNEEESIELLGKCFHEVLKDAPFDDDIKNYYLSRVDLCTNIQCDHKKVFRELVRLLRKTAVPKKYRRVFYQHKDKKKANQYNKHYVRLACGQQELVIYDKTYQMVENDLALSYENLPTGILRVEVHYDRSKLHDIEKKRKIDDPLELLWMLMQESKERILKLAAKCYPDLPYLRIEEGKAMIKGSSYQSSTKERMVILLEHMQRKQTIDKAFQAMEKQGYKTDDLLKRFQTLGLNPIPLRKGYAAKKMPSLAHILQLVGEKPVWVELEYWKWK